jgi:hypothetical protein
MGIESRNGVNFASLDCMQLFVKCDYKGLSVSAWTRNPGVETNGDGLNSKSVRTYLVIL